MGWTGNHKLGAASRSLRGPMHVALVTCERPIERDDDADHLIPALRQAGATVETPAWSAEVDWSAFDLIKPSSTWDYHERPGEFLDWLRRADRSSRLVNPLALLEWNLDKRYLRELAEAGVPGVPTVWADPADPATAVAEVGRQGWSDVVVKPAVDLGAMNLVRTPAERLGELLARYEQQTLVQPFLPSVASAGELSLVFIGGALSHSLRKRAAPGDFRVQPLYGGTHEPVRVSDEAVAVAERALELAPGEAVYARADLVAGERGLALIELELIEPALYLDVEPTAAPRLARALRAAAFAPAG